MDTQAQPAADATDLRISILYRKAAAAEAKLSFHTEIASKGTKPIGARATCGVLFIALGCFETALGAGNPPPLNGFEDCVVIDTATRGMYATSRDADEVCMVVKAAIRFFAKKAGIESMSESVTATLISEAVQVLNADDTKLNAPGGAA